MMPPHSHRYAAIVLGIWLVIILGNWLVGRGTGAAASGSLDQQLSTTVTSWEVFALKPEDTFARNGTIRVGRNDDGLVICGSVDGPDPVWAKAGNRIDGSDHIEVWLADATPAILPAIGWGNQFGFTYMTSATDFQELSATHRATAEQQAMGQQAWYQAQLPYRKRVTELFQRRWHLAPGRSEEYLASRAFSACTAEEQKRLAPLVVRGTPVMTTHITSAATFAFEILVPWEAFPPVRALSVQDLRLMVRVVNRHPPNYHSPEPPRSRIAQSGYFADTDLLPIRLATPREYTLTSFGFAMTDAMLDAGIPYTPSEEAVLYIRPGDTGMLDRVVVLENTSAGYQYEPKPDARSPVAHEARFWTRTFGEQGQLAGPRLTWRHDNVITRSDVVIGDPATLELRQDSADTLLLKHGPLVWWSRFGSGQCGACPRIGVELFRLRLADHTITSLVEYDDVVGDDGDITVSADWRVVSGYRQRWDSPTTSHQWERIDHVRTPDGQRYDKLPPTPVAGPPEPRNLTPSSQ